MKKISFILFISIAFSIQSTFKVEGMSCEMNCASKVQAKASSLDGINSCNVDFEKGLMTVDYDDKKTSNNQILSQLSADMEYKFSIVSLISNSSTQCSKSCCGKQKAEKKTLLQRVFSWF